MFKCINQSVENFMCVTSDKECNLYYWHHCQCHIKCHFFFLSKSKNVLNFQTYSTWKNLKEIKQKKKFRVTASSHKKTMYSTKRGTIMHSSVHTVNKLTNIQRGYKPQFPAQDMRRFQARRLGTWVQPPNGGITILGGTMITAIEFLFWDDFSLAVFYGVTLLSRDFELGLSTLCASTETHSPVV